MLNDKYQGKGYAYEADLGPDETAKVVEIDLGDIEKYRDLLPIIKNRRPDVY